MQGKTYENQERQIPSVDVQSDRQAQSIPLPAARVAGCSTQSVYLKALGSLVSRMAIPSQIPYHVLLLPRSVSAGETRHRRRQRVAVFVQRA
jgi:hypothetical protein